MNQMNIFGLKCDNNACDYYDETIQLEQYKEYIDYPCPKCSESLLTQEDFDTVMEIIKLADTIMPMQKQMDLTDEELFSVKFDLDGSGVPKITVDKYKG